MFSINHKQINLATRVSQTSWTTHVTRTVKTRLVWGEPELICVAHKLFGLKLGRHSHRERRRARRVAVLFQRQWRINYLVNIQDVQQHHTHRAVGVIILFFVSRLRGGPASRAGRRNVTSSSYFHLFVANASSPHAKDNVTIFKSQHVVVEAAPRIIFFFVVV